MIPLFEATSDPDRFKSPDGWDFSIYSLTPRSFWFSKTLLPVSPYLHITRYDFRSRVRFRARLRGGGVQINFIDSYSTANARLQGVGKINSIVMITLPGYDWDGLSDLGALGIELNFDAPLAEALLGPETLMRLGLLEKVFGARRSIVGSPTLAANRLRLMAEAFLRNFDVRANIVSNDPARQETRIMDQWTPEFGDIGLFNKSAFVEMARTVLDELALGPAAGQAQSSAARRHLALEVERLLWQAPESQDGDEISLDEFCVRFKASRRTIQLALQEQFGLGFKALQRVIRLHQVRRALRLGEVSTVSEAASQFYRYQFGRLSRDYRDLFGVLPSRELGFPVRLNMK